MAWVLFPNLASCGLRLLLVLISTPRVFLQALRVSSLHKNQHSKFQFEWETVKPTDSQQTPVSRQVIKERRELLSAQLKGHKSERLKRKLPLESQLSISQEEVQIKKQMLQRMDTMDKAYSNSMEKLTSSMEKLTGSISDGFTLLQRMMCQPLNNMNMNPQFMMPSHHLQMYPRAQTSAQSTVSRSHHNGQFSYTQALYSDNDTTF